MSIPIMPLASSQPPVMSVRERNAIAKQQAILDAAMHLFADRGYHGVAVPEVASKANVGAGTIYRYYKNKEDLVNHVFRHAKGLLADALLDNFPFNEGYREQFREFWARLMQFCQDKPVAFRFLELQDHTPYLDEESKTLEQKVLNPILQFCERAKSDGIARAMPAEVLMAIIWGAFVGIVKAEDYGYINTSPKIFADAENACWELFKVPPAE